VDIEWLLSTLFDASLLSPSSRRQRRLFFCLSHFGALRYSGPPAATMSSASPAGCWTARPCPGHAGCTWAYRWVRR